MIRFFHDIGFERTAFSGRRQALTLDAKRGPGWFTMELRRYSCLGCRFATWGILVARTQRKPRVLTLHTLERVQKMAEKIADRLAR